MGMYSGLLLAWELGYRQLVVESDCMDALRLIQQGAGSGRCGSLSLLLHIQKPCNQNWRVLFQHVSRVGNKVADMVAKLVDNIRALRFSNLMFLLWKFLTYCIRIAF
ncbi:hypothetical protein V6N13_127766 [Hibiscus sabdariffa]|uniref:RNase H type-1 domain-containing protein n=1 Tax=Hibiscus sabdariffa TaxID=183260 RepID=A0ABR2CE20_9ROSI